MAAHPRACSWGFCADWGWERQFPSGCSSIPCPRCKVRSLGGDDDDHQRQHLTGRNLNESPILGYQPRKRRAQTLPLGANISRRDCSYPQDEWHGSDENISSVDRLILKWAAASPRRHGARGRSPPTQAARENAICSVRPRHQREGSLPGAGGAGLLKSWCATARPSRLSTASMRVPSRSSRSVRVRKAARAASGSIPGCK